MMCVEAHGMLLPSHQEVYASAVSRGSGAATLCLRVIAQSSRYAGAVQRIMEMLDVHDYTGHWLGP